MPPLASAVATVVIVAWNGEDLIDACLDAVAAQELPDAYLLSVIDNDSADSTAAHVYRHPAGAELVRLERNIGFAGAVELAVRTAVTPFVVVLNQDARPSAGWLAALLAPLLAPDSARVAAVTSKVLFVRDGHLNNTGVVVGLDGYGRDRGFDEPDDGRFGVVEDVFAFSGTAAAIRVLAAREVGSFDASFFLYYEDTDLSWRLQLGGWRILYEPAAVVHHVHAASSDVGSVSFAFYNERNRLLMLVKCAPLSFVAREVARFAAITVLLPLRRLARVNVPSAHQFRLPVRVRVLGSFVRLLPGMVVKRRAVSRIAQRTRANVARELSA